MSRLGMIEVIARVPDRLNREIQLDMSAQVLCHDMHDMEAG
jgi:hypothetical protein